MPLVISKPEHEVAYADLCRLCSKHANSMTAAEVLAVAANMVGKLVAMQDAQTMTAEMAMSIVHLNIANGNQQAIEMMIPVGSG